MRRLLVLALLTVSTVAEETPEAAWQALRKQYNDARTEFFRPWREAKEKGEAFTLDYTKHPDRTFPAKFKTFAQKHSGKPVAALAWAEIVRLGPTEEAKVEALRILFEHHMDSKAMRSVVWSLRFRNDTERLQMIAEKSPHEEVRGFALLVKGQVVKKRDAAAAKTIFLEVKEKYPAMSARAEGELFELEHLAIGRTVPEIEGEDIDGVAFKLSDYRGKVVMLDFWGDW